MFTAGCCCWVGGGGLLSFGDCHPGGVLRGAMGTGVL